MLLCCQIHNGEGLVEVVSRWKNKNQARTRRRVLMNVEEGARQVPLRQSAAGGKRAREGSSRRGRTRWERRKRRGSRSMSADEKGAKFQDNPIMTLAPERACLKATHEACSSVDFARCPQKNFVCRIKTKKVGANADSRRVSLLTPTTRPPRLTRLLLLFPSLCAKYAERFRQQHQQIAAVFSCWGKEREKVEKNRKKRREKRRKEEEKKERERREEMEQEKKEGKGRRIG
jgi:hypothetical protein